jgi:hypothetical protein
VNDFVQKYGLGVILAGVLVFLGIKALVLREVDMTDYYSRWHHTSLPNVITGARAISLGAFCLGAGGLLFTVLYLQDNVRSRRGLIVTHALQASALVVCIVGLVLFLLLGILG